MKEPLKVTFESKDGRKLERLYEIKRGYPKRIIEWLSGREFDTAIVDHSDALERVRRARAMYGMCHKDFCGRVECRIIDGKAHLFKIT